MHGAMTITLSSEQAAWLENRVANGDFASGLFSSRYFDGGQAIPKGVNV
jgi:hypothetical protein